MGKIIEIGVLAHSETPKNLETPVEAIFRAQLKKLSSILGHENLVVHSSVNNWAEEMACISAIEEGVRLVLSQISKMANTTHTPSNVRKKIYDAIARREETSTLDREESDEELASNNDIVFLIYDKNDSDEAARFESVKRKLFRLNSKFEGSPKLSIEINTPKVWASDADERMYFEYISRTPCRSTLVSEIEIPKQILSHWLEQIAATKH